MALGAEAGGWRGSSRSVITEAARFSRVECEGGVLTPASCMGLRLVERLRRADMTFDVLER